MKDTLCCLWIRKSLISMSGEKFKGHNPHMRPCYRTQSIDNVIPVNSLKILVASLLTAQSALQIHVDSGTQLSRLMSDIAPFQSQ